MSTKESMAKRVAHQYLMSHVAFDFSTEKARKKYLKEHPKADPKLHTVTKGKDKKKKEDKPSGKKKNEDHPVESPKDGKKMLEKRKGKPPATPDELPEDAEKALRERYNLEIVGDDAHQAHDIAEAIKKGIDDSSDVCKLSPPVCTENKGLTRDKMPQIEGGKSAKEMLASDDELERKKGKAMVEAGADPDDDRPVMRQLLDHLASNGAKSKDTRIRVGELKATQQEIKADKTFGIADKYLKGDWDSLTEDPKVMISRDGYILDGHHRWAAVLTVDPHRTMNVVAIDMDMDELLHEAASFPGVYQANFEGDPLDESKQKSYKKKHKSKLKKAASQMTQWVFLKEARTFKADRRFFVSVNSAESYAPYISMVITSDHIPSGMFALDAANQIEQLAKEQRKLAGFFLNGIVQTGRKFNVQAKQGPFMTRLELPGGIMVVNTGMTIDCKVQDGSQTSEFWGGVKLWADQFSAEFKLRK